MWGDTSLSAPQLLAGGNIKYLVADYLAEVTMAIMARQKQGKETAGYATDFIQTMKRHLPEIMKKNVKVVVNAGGVNVQSCRAALLKVAEALKIDLKVGIVIGDDLSDRQDELAESKTEMFTGQPFPEMALSSNAYLGAFPIAQLLKDGCHVVITGRVVDSALVLGPCIHEFGWGPEDFDKLSSGTLAGHLVECGAQGTGGLFTDWRSVNSWVNIGFPIVEVEASGDFVLTKPPKTDGLVSPASAAEQMLYEIQDPGAYHVPDVACDWTQVTFTQVSDEVVRVSGARGQPPTDTYKCITTHLNGFKFVCMGTIIGHEAREKGQRVGHTLLTRWRHMLKARKKDDFTETRVEVLGSDFEVTVRIGVKHPDKSALDPLKRECAAASVSMVQGGLFQPGSVTPLISGFMFLMKKSEAPVSIDSGAGPSNFAVKTDGGFKESASLKVKATPAEAPKGPVATMPLRQLCWSRSGDKGNSSNIGLIARKPEYLPFLRHVVTNERVRNYFQPDCKGKVERFDLPGIHGMNFLLHDSLGGGGTSSLYTDPLAKTLGSKLLEMMVEAPAEWGMSLSKL